MIRTLELKHLCFKILKITNPYLEDLEVETNDGEICLFRASKIFIRRLEKWCFYNDIRDPQQLIGLMAYGQRTDQFRMDWHFRK